MNAFEIQLLREIEGRLEGFARDLASATWERRREAARDVFALIHAAWWRRYAAGPDRHAHDVQRINEILGLQGDDTQLAETSEGEILPPKFFGGDPIDLEETFVLSVTLNHALPATRKFQRELADLQTEDACWRSHAGYFQQDYVHRVFFSPRAKVLLAFVGALPPAIDRDAFADPNRSRSLYLEVLPTRSRTFRLERITPEQHAALADVFTMALNDVARRTVLRILRPRHALLVGRAAADYLPITRAAAPHPMGCGVSTDSITVEWTGVTVRVVRCGFIGRGGPRRKEELAQLGRLLVSDSVGATGAVQLAGLSRAQMIALIEAAGFGVLDKTGWTHVVSGRRVVRHDRFLTFRKGTFVREIHLRGHASALVPPFEPVSEAEARANHVGSVRFRLFPGKHTAEAVERALRDALVAS